MAKKGSVTVFLVLILSLMLALVTTSIESVRMAAARTQILNGMDIGLFSLFGQYDRMLLEDYDLFALDGSCGGSALNMSSVYDNLESYIKPVLKQNSQKLSLTQGGFTGYRLLTDNGGEDFCRQAVRYMKETLGIQGAALLLQKIRSQDEETRDAQRRGEQAENGDTIQSYDREMKQASQNSQEALEEAKNNQPGEEETPLEPVAPPVENPITAIRRIRRMGILELVIPPGKGVSDRQVNKNELLTGRTLQQGMPMKGDTSDGDAYTDQILFQQYLMKHLGNYDTPGTNGLRYQIEYILGGKKGDIENLKSVANRLLMIREGVNFACLAADGAKRAQVQALALAIASGFLIPPASAVIEAALLFCWSFAESILDVRELFDGGRVPLVKSPDQWQLSLEKLPRLLEALDTERKNTPQGMAYKDYLQVLLLNAGKENKVMRGMDMTELAIRKAPGRENFRMDSCITAMEASVDVQANKRKTFTVTRQYYY